MPHKNHFYFCTKTKSNNFRILAAVIVFFKAISYFGYLAYLKTHGVHTLDALE